MAEPVWVRWHGSKVHAVRLGPSSWKNYQMVCGKWVSTVKENAWFKPVHADLVVVERGPNPCRRCLAAIGRRES